MTTEPLFSTARAGAPAPARAAEVVAGLRLAEDWRRHVDGGAPRLGPDEVIWPTRPVGRWVGVETRLGTDGWRSPARWAAVGAWTATVIGAGWIGRRYGVGPLAGLADLDRFGEALAGHTPRRTSPGVM